MRRTMVDVVSLTLNVSAYLFLFTNWKAPSIHRAPRQFVYWRIKPGNPNRTRIFSLLSLLTVDLWSQRRRRRCCRHELRLCEQSKATQLTEQVFFIICQHGMRKSSLKQSRNLDFILEDGEIPQTPILKNLWMG